MYHFKWMLFVACLVMAVPGQSAASSYDDCRAGNGFLEPEKQVALCDEALKAALDAKQKAFVQFKRGEALYWMNNFGPALEDVDLAIQGDPKLVSAYLRRAWIFLTFGQWDEASRYIEDVLAQEPRSAEGLFALSYLYSSIEPNSARVFEALQQSLQINPNLHLARLNLAYKYYYRGDIEGMLREFGTILKHDDAELDKVSFRRTAGLGEEYAFGAHVRFERAKYLMFANRNNEAIAGFNWLISNYPKAASAFVLRGQILRYSNNEADALKDYSHAVELDPSNVEARRGKAWTLFELKRLDEAMAESDWLTSSFSPVRGEGYRLRAYIDKMRGNGDQALLDYEEAFRLDREIFRRTQERMIELGYVSSQSGGNYTEEFRNGVRACIADPECY